MTETTAPTRPRSLPYFTAALLLFGYCTIFMAAAILVQLRSIVWAMGVASVCSMHLVTMLPYPSIFQDFKGSGSLKLMALSQWTLFPLGLLIWKCVVSENRANAAKVDIPWFVSYGIFLGLTLLLWVQNNRLAITYYNQRRQEDVESVATCRNGSHPSPNTSRTRI